MRTRHKQQTGFTLVEVILVMVITGIIGGMVAIFIRAPVQGYVDSARRAELTDIADTAERRIARDIRTAVPNSVRIPGSCGTSSSATCVEFIPTKDGGRYRASGTGNVLSFGSSGSTIFDVIGDATGNPLTVARNDYIVVGSTQSNNLLSYENSPYNTAAVGVLRNVTLVTNSAGVQTITINSSFPITADINNPPSPPLQRFDVVDGTQQAVTYACENDPNFNAADGPLMLVRHWNYWSGAGTPYAAYASGSGGKSATLATKVSACTITYDVANQRLGLLTILLTLNSNGEIVTLYNEIHVNNSP
jgi:MSHA biogenesis protein MshO